MRTERVVLLGFMGAGKTTVGRLLAAMLGWRFLDTDDMLVERRSASIASLFEQFGEPQFREWEAEIVAKALAGRQVVVALGGGAIEHPQTRALLTDATRTLTVFLETPLPIAFQRCSAQPEAAVRPVLVDADRLQERYERRLPLYRAAHLAFSTEAQTPAALARTIAETLMLRA